MHSRRLTIALWTVAVLLAGGLAALLFLPGHGSSRSNVADYIAAVNAETQTFARKYRTIDAAYRSFALDPDGSARELARVRAAAQKLRSLRAHTAAIDAPAEAARLRRLLLAYFRSQETVANELVAVSAYVPRIAAAERPLAGASVRVRSEVRAHKTAREQAAAFAAYADALEGAAAAVAAIAPPPFFGPAHGAEVARLRRSARAVRGVSGALLDRNRGALDEAIRQLGQPSTAGTAAVRTAIQEYNRRVRRIRLLAAAVERERARLDRQL